MGRKESKQAFEQSSQMARQNQGNAQMDRSKAIAATEEYKGNVDRFTRFGRGVYGPNGEYIGATNAKATAAAAAGSRAVEGDLALRALRTGENTAGYASAVGEERRRATRDITETLAGAEQDRLDRLMALEQYGVEASKVPIGLYSGLYGTDIGGANSAMGSASEAGKTPGFWDTFAPALVGAAGQAAAGFAG